MKVTCQECRARFKISDDKVPEQGLAMNCPKCKSSIVVYKDASSSAPAEATSEEHPAPPDFAADTDTAEADAPPELPTFEAGLDEDLSLPEDDSADFDSDDLLDTQVADQSSGAPRTTEDGDMMLPPDSTDMEDEFTISDDEFSPPEVAVGSDFSLDDALADLDDAMEDSLEMDEQESLPSVPETPTPPDEIGDIPPDMVFDEPMGDELPGDIDPAFDESAASGETSADSVDDEFSLDMPSLLENAAAELEKEMASEVPSQAEGVPELPDQDFSFDEMLGEDELPSALGDGEIDEQDALPDLDDLPSDLGEMGDPDQLSGEQAKTLSDDLFDEFPDISNATDKADMYHVRRPNGKVFGPYPPVTIMEMLKDNKLQGDEEVSLDKEVWSSIGTVEVFSKAVEQVKVQEKDGDAVKRSLDLDEERKRIKEKTKRRMHTGSLDVVTPMKQKPIRIKPKTAIPVAVLAILIIVLGYFQFVQEVSVFSLLSGENISDRPLHLQLKSRHRKVYNEAAKEMEKDSYKGLLKARETLKGMLKVTDFRGIGSVWALLAQVDYQILRRYDDTKELKEEAAKMAAQIEKIRKEEPEILYAKATKLIYEKNINEAKDVLLKALISEPRSVKALHLVAETFLFLPDKSPAEKYLDKLIESKQATARTYFLKGSLAVSSEKFDMAKENYSKALEMDPNSLDSQIELAGILLNEDGGAQKSERELHTIRNSFKDRLSKKQLGRVHYYSGLIYLKRNEPYKVVKELTAAIENEPTNYQYNMTLGEFYLQKHEYEKAQEQNTRCLQSNKLALRCHLNLARTLLTLELPDQALFKLEDATKIAPKSAEIQFLLGKAYEDLFKPQKALQKYEQAISMDPNGIVYYTSAAMSYMKQDNLTKAGEYIQKAKLINPNSPLVHSFLGQMLLYQGDQDKAEIEFKKAIEIDPNFEEAHRQLASTYREAKKFDKAIAQFEKVLSLDDKADIAYFGLGLTYFQMGDVDKAIGEFEKALNLNKRRYRYFFHSGVAYYTKGNLESAADAFNKATVISPGKPDSLFYLGRIAMDTKQFSVATEKFEQALQLDKNKAEYYFFYGLLQAKQEKFDDSIAFYEQALTLNPEYAQAYLQKGISLRALNKYVSAIKMFRIAQKKDDSISVARIELGDCYFEMSRYDDSIKQYLAAIKMIPDDPEPFKKLGLVYQEKRKPNKAIAYLKQAVEIDPDDPQSHLGLGYAYKALRKKRQAIRSFELYLELNPMAIDREEVEDEIFWLKNR